jgi:hypothetical protein
LAIEFVLESTRRPPSVGVEETSGALRFLKSRAINGGGRTSIFAEFG